MFSKNRLKFAMIFVVLVPLASFALNPRVIEGDQVSTVEVEGKARTPRKNKKHNGDRKNRIKNRKAEEVNDTVTDGFFDASVGEVETGSSKKHAIGVGLGETFLTGDFGDYGNNGITLDLMYSYLASYSFDLLVNGHYSKHEMNGEQVTLQGIAFGIKSRLYRYDAFAPFLLGGLGFYRPQVTYKNSAQKLVETERKTAFGLNLGLGADLQLNNSFLVGLMGHYHNPFDLKQNDGPKVEGSYFKLLITFNLIL